jgi:enoyl-CoA hydratase
MTEPVVVTRHGGVAVLTLNRPDQRNALAGPVIHAIDAAMTEVEADPTARCVVVTGAGRAFCAGADLSILRAAADGDFATVTEVYEGFLRILRSPLVTIAAVNGAAVGAGFNLALACDVRLAGRSAKFDTRFAELRIHPGGGHAWLLARAVGQQRATLACLFGEVWTADQARDAGLVATVHEDADLVPAAVALGSRLDGQDAAYTRRLVATLHQSLVIPTHAEALAAEAEAQRWSTTLPAFREGLAAIEARIAGRQG